MVYAHALREERGHARTQTYWPLPDLLFCLASSTTVHVATLTMCLWTFIIIIIICLARELAYIALICHKSGTARVL